MQRNRNKENQIHQKPLIGEFRKRKENRKQERK